VTTVDVPHRLGREGAKARLQSRAGELGSHMPGGVAEVTSAWTGAYEMALRIGAMGQGIAARLEVEEARVRVHLELPAMLTMFSGMIGSAVRESGAKLLEDKRG
jgi:hypothetical protein